MNIAENPKYYGYQGCFVSIIYNFFDKKPSGRSVKIETITNQEIAAESHKPIIRKLEKRKVYSSFKDNIGAVDLVDMQLISKFNKGLRFLLCIVDIYSTYVWVVISTKAFEETLDECRRKPKKMMVR